jgi:hypothetical protein
MESAGQALTDPAGRTGDHDVLPIEFHGRRW